MTPPDSVPPRGPGSARRLALVEIAVGVPAMLLVAFGLVLGVRLAGRSLRDPVVWWALGPVLGAFLVYFARALLRLRRAREEEGSAGTE